MQRLSEGRLWRGQVGSQEGREGEQQAVGTMGSAQGIPTRPNHLPRISGFTGTEVLPTCPSHPSPHTPRVKLPPWPVPCLYPPDMGSYLLPPHRPALADFRAALRVGAGEAWKGRGYCPAMSPSPFAQSFTSPPPRSEMS